MESSTQRLLSAVWGNRQGFVFTPYKDLDRQWHETSGFPYRGKPPKLTSLPQRADLYFCPVVFSKAKRRKEYALSTNVLWADLDPVHPSDCRLRPSVAWESSPGRYQALWFLTQEVEPEVAASLSKRIAYADGGDKGGWDLTQVLRIPGTRNFKYESEPEVKLLWAKRLAYSPSEITKTYPPLNGESTTSSTEDSGQSGISLKDILSISEDSIQTAILTLPIGLKRRLFVSTAGADRSLELQKLARDLVKWGVNIAVVYHLLQRSTWNKFAGRADEQSQLLNQLSQANIALASRVQSGQTEIQSVSSTESSGTTTLEGEVEPIKQMEVHNWTSFMSIPTQLRWLIQDSWVDRTVGFISGRSKSYKTWMALDMALSVVSGGSFLGEYPVARTGPVLLIQEEDPTAILQERLRLIAKAKGMLPTAEVDGTTIRLDYPDYPLSIINMQAFSLGQEEKVNQVRQFIAEVNPIMVILDPLVVMMGKIDEYRATDVSLLLQSVKMWREEFGCNVCIVHHWNKTKSEDGDRGGGHMYGSFAFHAWLESALHVEPIVDPDSNRIDSVVVEREFKAAAGGRSLKLKFDIDTVDDYKYEVSIEGAPDSPMTLQLLDQLSQAGGKWVSIISLTTNTGHSRPSVSKIMTKLMKAGRVDGDIGGGRGRTSRFRIPE